MRPLRVGLFTDVFLPDHNGVSTSVLLLARELRRQGHDAWIITPAVPGYVDTEDCIVRLRSFTNPALPRQRMAVPGKRRLLGRFDLIHTHTPWVAGWWGARLASRWEAPHVATFHTHLEAYTHYVPGLSRLDRRVRAVQRLARRFYETAEVLVAPSSESARVVQGYGVTRPVRVVPTGIDPRLLEAAPPLSGPWPAGTRRLLSVGRLGHEKRFEVVLEALRQLRTQHNAHLAIIGEGPQASELRALAARLGVADAVTFVGPVPLAHMGAYYRQAELFLFGSDTETQGLVLHEAQVMGVPVVAVGAQGTLDGVRNGESGFLVAPGDASGLARHAHELLSSSTLHTAFSAGARSFARASTVEGVTARMLDVYAEAFWRASARPWTDRSPDVTARRSTLLFGRRGS
ncbi:glycosyltransferase [Deinococcus maricopensis]|uniref:Glycosyl transferase group 1 n=1 Tax=Deinococcus maricopensis (strain DSM 21211 / LMG 22137 / NRRL B-23946 / LB-34) TaxID=709986 RepID=E8U5B4_DEIML|nr:glycosyltransferase [Deinococcus maricopensis]ADV66253.1 glycosyl transferase group 1 [Deinococcus maricopensis DSM 21211]